jgi:hypothetical protein
VVSPRNSFLSCRKFSVALSGFYSFLRCHGDGGAIWGFQFQARTDIAIVGSEEIRPMSQPRGQSMKFAALFICASTAVIGTSVAAEPEYDAVEKWLKPASGQETLGPAHGDVAVSQNGDVYVSVLNSPNGGIQVFNAEGEYLRNVPGAPNDFHGFVIHKEAAGEFIYGARLGGQTILKMQLDGKVVLQMDGSLIPAELVRKRNGKPTLRLTAVDVAPDGRIFAVDGYSSDMIHIFSAEGEYLKSFGGKKAPYSFKTCHKIAIDTRYNPPRII